MYEEVPSLFENRGQCSTPNSHSVTVYKFNLLLLQLSFDCIRHLFFLNGFIMEFDSDRVFSGLTRFSSSEEYTSTNMILSSALFGIQ